MLTCGYRPEKGTDLFAEGMRRWCRHTGMRWLGSLEERHMGCGTVFMDGEKASRAGAFAQTLMTQLTDAYDAADRRFCSRGASSAVTAIFSMSPGRNGSIPAHRMAETSMPLPMYPLRITAM